MSFPVNFQGCKAIGDSRFATDYRPDCSMNLEIRKKYNLVNNTDYRLFLQRNGDIIRRMNEGRVEHSEQSYCQCNKQNTLFDAGWNLSSSFDQNIAVVPEYLKSGKGWVDGVAFPYDPKGMPNNIYKETNVGYY